MSVQEKKPYLLGAIYLNPTDRCNLKCRHCWLSPASVHVMEPEGKKNRTFTSGLSLEGVEDVIRQARPLGLHTIKITGGEPFLRTDLLDFIALFHRQGLSVDIETNGTLVDEKKAAALKRFEVRNISVSLDGHQAGTHDRIRGVEGAFEGAVRGIRHLRKQGLGIQIILSLSRENRHEMQGVALLAESLGAQSMKINPVLPIGRGEVMHKTDHALSVGELIEVSLWVRERLQPGVKIPVYYGLPAAFQPFGAIMAGSCGSCAILNILGIVENGDISFCGIEKVEGDLVMGNINRDRLDDLWANHPILEEMRASIPWRLEGICGQCFLKKICLGSCRACAYHLEKRLTAPYWFCQEAFEKGLFPETRYFQKAS
ncbi:MAG: radical SAM protein [Pseudomonadota bacterium]